MKKNPETKAFAFVATFTVLLIATVMLVTSAMTVLYGVRYLVTFNNDFLGLVSGMIVLYLLPIGLEAIVFSLFNVNISNLLNTDIYMLTIFGVGFVFIFGLVAGALPLLVSVMIAVIAIITAVCRAYVVIKITYWLLK